MPLLLFPNSTRDLSGKMPGLFLININATGPKSLISASVLILFCLAVILVKYLMWIGSSPSSREMSGSLKNFQKRMAELLGAHIRCVFPASVPNAVM